MTSKGQITKIASRDGVDARVVERDYVLVHAVALISAHDTDRTLIFKGGTALRSKPSWLVRGVPRDHVALRPATPSRDT